MSESPINHVAVTNILDRAHQALRTIDAGNPSKPVPERDLVTVSYAIASIEEFARERGIKLSEFQSQIRAVDAMHPTPDTLAECG